MTMLAVARAYMKQLVKILKEHRKVVTAKRKRDWNLTTKSTNSFRCSAPDQTNQRIPVSRTRLNLQLVSLYRYIIIARNLIVLVLQGLRHVVKILFQCSFCTHDTDSYLEIC